MKEPKEEMRYSHSKKKKDFLSHTNGTEMIIRNRKQQDHSDNDFSEANSSSNYNNNNPKKNAKSIDKTTKKKQLTKTQEIPPKPRSSLEGYNPPSKKGGK